MSAAVVIGMFSVLVMRPVAVVDRGHPRRRRRGAGDAGWWAAGCGGGNS